MKRILAIGAHFDDVEMGCGGSLLLHHDRGDEITIAVLCSDDTYGGDIIVRLKEQQQVKDILGANIILGNSTDSTKKIISGLDQVDPDVIYLPFRTDYHQDHRKVNILGMSVARKMRSDVLQYFVSSSYDYYPNVFRRIDFKRKMELFNVYQSQIQRRPEYHQIMQRMNEFHASLIGERQPGMGVEGFYVHRMVIE